MGAYALSKNELIMNYTSPPSVDDLQVIARGIMETLPDTLSEMVEVAEIDIQIDEFPDVVLEQEMELETPYDLLALFRSGKEIAPGVQKKVANNKDSMLLFRRPILDLWNETCEDLNILLREVIVEEIARSMDFSEEEIQEILREPFQGFL